MAATDTKVTTPRASTLLANHIAEVKAAALSRLAKARDYAAPARVSFFPPESSDKAGVVVVTILSNDESAVRTHTDSDNNTQPVVFAFRPGSNGITGPDEVGAYTGGMKPVTGFWAYQQSVAGDEFLQKLAPALVAGEEYPLGELLESINELPVSCRGPVTATALGMCNVVDGVCSYNGSDVSRYLATAKK